MVVLLTVDANRDWSGFRPRRPGPIEQGRAKAAVNEDLDTRAQAQRDAETAEADRQRQVRAANIREQNRVRARIEQNNRQERARVELEKAKAEERNQRRRVASQVAAFAGTFIGSELVQQQVEGQVTDQVTNAVEGEGGLAANFDAYLAELAADAGLNEEDLELLRELGRDILIEIAIGIGITIALSFIPVVGTVAGAVITTVRVGWRVYKITRKGKKYRRAGKLLYRLGTKNVQKLLGGGKSKGQVLKEGALKAVRNPDLYLDAGFDAVSVVAAHYGVPIPLQLISARGALKQARSRVDQAKGAYNQVKAEGIKATAKQRARDIGTGKAEQLFDSISPISIGQIKNTREQLFKLRNTTREAKERTQAVGNKYSIQNVKKTAAVGVSGYVAYDVYASQTSNTGGNAQAEQTKRTNSRRRKGAQKATSPAIHQKYVRKLAALLGDEAVDLCQRKVLVRITPYKKKRDIASLRVTIRGDRIQVESTTAPHALKVDFFQRWLKYELQLRLGGLQAEAKRFAMQNASTARGAR